MMKFLKKVFRGQETDGISESMHFLYEEIRPILSRFMINGALPLKFTSSGVAFNFFSYTMLYCIIFYLFSLPMVLLTLVEQAKPIRNSDKVDEIIFSQLYILMLVPYIFIPVTLWLDAPHISDYLNAWTNYQKRHLEVTGKRLPMSFSRQCNAEIYISTIASLIIVSFWTSVPPFLKPWDCGVYFFYCISMNYPTLILWTYNCRALCIAGISLSECLEEASVIPHTASNIFEMKILWLNLSQLTDQFGHSFYRFYSFVNITTFWFFTSSLFGSLICLRNQQYGRLLVFVTTFFICATPFYRTADASHRVPLHVRDGVKKSLQKMSMSTLQPFVWDEVHSFLECISSLKNQSITFGGFVNFNRQLFHRAGSTAVTYIVVLLQIKQGVSTTK